MTSQIVALSDLASERNRRAFMRPLERRLEELQIPGLHWEYTLAGWKDDPADIFAKRRFKRDCVNGLIITIEGWAGHIRVLAVSTLTVHPGAEYVGPNPLLVPTLGVTLRHAPFPAKGNAEYEVSIFSRRLRGGKEYSACVAYFHTEVLSEAVSRIGIWAAKRAKMKKAPPVRIFEPREDEAKQV